MRANQLLLSEHSVDLLPQQGIVPAQANFVGREGQDVKERGWADVATPCRATPGEEISSIVEGMLDLKTHQDGAMHVGAIRQWCHCLRWGVMAADHNGYNMRGEAQ